MAPEPLSTSTSSALLPFLPDGSRRGSLVSLISTKSGVDRDVLAQALDDIHNSASRSEALTSFRDYEGASSRAGGKEKPSYGINDLFGRVKRGLGGAIGESWDSRPGSKSVDAHPVRSSSSNRDDRKASSLQRAVATNNVVQISDPQKRVSNIREPQESAQTKDNGSHGITAAAMPNHSARNMQASVVRRSSIDNADRMVTTNIDLTGDPSTAAIAHVVKVKGTDLTNRASTYSSQRPLVSSINEIASKSQQTMVDGVQKSTEKLGRSLQNGDLSQRSSNEFATNDPAGTQIRYEDKSTSQSFEQDSARLPRQIQADDKSKRPQLSVAKSETALQPTGPRLDEMQSGRSTALSDKYAKTQIVSTRSNIGEFDPVLQHLKRRVISKGFWMKDENAKDCFSCGQSFSAFRRKHHCRTCGQIFDAKCTVLVPGHAFGQPSTLRLCKPCESMVFGSDDDSSVFTDDLEVAHSPRRRRGQSHDSIVSGNLNPNIPTNDNLEILSVPSIGIPVSRRNRDAKQRSNILEFDTGPMLPRPSSSHSLISLARRPRSSSHRRHQPRPSVLRARVLSADDRIPFHPTLSDERMVTLSRSNLQGEHFIDPELEPFASDGASDDDYLNDSLLVNNNSQTSHVEEKDKSTTRTGLSKTWRSRSGTLSSVPNLKDDDDQFQNMRQNLKSPRKRNASFSSLSINSPRRNKSKSLLKVVSQSDDPSKLLLHLPKSAAKGLNDQLMRGSATCCKSLPPAEFNALSLKHLRDLLSQVLKDSDMALTSTWEKVLFPIILQCIADVEPNVRFGDDMDIRDYIKIKKVPGGRPIDSSYVSGVVFTKNVALKSMPRRINNCRIAIVTFAIEYARHEAHFMSLEPVIAQEQEYLHNLVSRITSLQPHVLLVQRNVSGMALDLLERAGITVAYNIKPSVLAAVARMTQTTLIKSVDKLAIGKSQLGGCERFEVKTYVHNDHRKTFIFMAGCAPDLGCTVLLRGADTKSLRRLKRITEFICYVAYNLKLETSLLHDEMVSQERMDIERCDNTEFAQSGSGTRPADGSGPSLEQDHNMTHSEKIEADVKSKILSTSPFVAFTPPYMLTQLRETEQKLDRYKTLRDQYAAVDHDAHEEYVSNHNQDFELVRPDMVDVAASADQSRALRDYLRAVHEAQFEKGLYIFDTQRRTFESFMSGHTDPFDPFAHQSLAILYSTVSTLNSAPCTGPEVLYIGFYAGLNHAEAGYEEDCSLGQYVEDCCTSADAICKDCNKSMSDHHRQYVHGYGQISISIRKNIELARRQSKTILMWATCRICQQETTKVHMSENTWRFSFAKYLELGFSSISLTIGSNTCQHDIHKDFVRCFSFEDHVLRVQYDPVEIYNIIVPRAMITWKVENDLRIKNEQFLHFEARLHAFTDSVKKRLHSINVDTLDEKLATEVHGYLDELRTRVDADHEELLKKLQDKYSNSRYYEVIPLNRALRFMDQKALEWDEVFNNFERDYFPSETDIRNLATLQLRNMFLESQPVANIMSSEISEAEENAARLNHVPSSILDNTFTRPEQHVDEKGIDQTSSIIAPGIMSVEKPAQEGIPKDETRVQNTLSNQSQAPNRLNGDVAEGNINQNDIEGNHGIATPHGASNLAVNVQSKLPQLAPTSEVKEGSPNKSLTEHLEGEDQMKSKSRNILELVEQREPHNAEEVNSELPQSRIPRLYDLQKHRNEVRSQSPVAPRMPTRDAPTVHMDAENDKENGDESQSVLPHRSNTQQMDRKLVVSRIANRFGKIAPSLIPRSVPMKAVDVNCSTVSALAEHFEQMSREFEKKRLMERHQRAMRSRQARANPLASSQPVVEVYSNATDAVKDHDPDVGFEEEVSITKEASTIRDQTRPSATSQEALSTPETQPATVKPTQRFVLEEDDAGTDPESARETDFVQHEPPRPRARKQSDAESQSEPDTSTPLSLVGSQVSQVPSELSIPEYKKNVWLKYLADFWSKRSASGWANLDYPLRPTEHVFEDSDIIVREDEPSSIIALALSCDDYKSKVREFRGFPSARTDGSAHPSKASTTARSAEHQEKEIEASLLSNTGTHMKYSFSHGLVKVSCKIFYAESFDALRRKCSVADRFVESLSRCLKFDSKGGKTKSLFLKTLDDRFIVKSLQEVELRAFTRFAPDYFAFMGHTLFHGVPSVIAKMFGLFQVTIKSPVTGMDFSYYLLVMENLFYEHNPNRRFDLKGSMRNRKIESTGQPDEVLLDENLVETIFESPLFVREHSRKLLQASVWNDTMWLCKQNVMDYSLMAGFDDERKELVVGIIDCIRTYTWDKKLESWIKDRGKNKPTITSPKDYRNRFRVSMMQYMLVAPTTWHQFQAQMAAPKTLKEREEDGISAEQDKHERFCEKRST